MPHVPFRSLFGVALILCLLAEAAVAGWNPFACLWPLMPRTRHRPTEYVPNDFGPTTLDLGLLSQVRRFTPHQAALSNIMAVTFAAGRDLRFLLGASASGLEEVVADYPLPSRPLHEHFGLVRNTAKLARYLVPITVAYPRSSENGWGEEHLPLLSHRMLSEERASGKRARAEDFLADVCLIRPTYYLRRGATAPLTTVLYVVTRDPMDDNAAYFSLPELPIRQQLLLDAETRLAEARTLTSLVQRKREFWNAFYAYWNTGLYEYGNLTVGWPVFAGIYLALTGEKLHSAYSYSEWLGLTNLTQTEFVDRFLGED